MPATITVFARKPATKLTRDYLTDLLHDPIVGDLAKDLGLDYAATLGFLRRCEVHEVASQAFSIVVPNRQSIAVTRTSASDANLVSAHDSLNSLSRGSRVRVERLLGEVDELVKFDIDWAALDREEFVATWYAALELAHTTSGLVLDYENRWWDPAKRAASLK